MKINYDFYKYYENVPITQLADILGLEHGKNGKYRCPCHDDTNPSLFLTENGKYENRFKCFACGEGGNPLLLTLAVRSHIKPSLYFLDPKKYRHELEDAASFIDQYFPGGIIENTQTHVTKNDGPQLPNIPYRLLKEIGLSTNPFLSCNVRPYNEILFDPYEDQSIYKRIFKEKKDDKYVDKEIAKPIKLEPLDTLEAAKIIKDKIGDYMDDFLTSRYEFFKKYYPDMPLEGRKYINKMNSERYDEAANVYHQLENYIDYHQNKELIQDDLDEKGE